jgi:methylated-DNA-[protein]-cysteine S-methyltransferase
VTAVVRYDAPFGPILLEASDLALTGASFNDGPPATVADSERAAAIVRDAVRQLDEYFAGRRRCFELPLAPAGTPFQQRAWQAIAAIPYGETRSYGEIAAAAGLPRASRAAGMACATNPIAVIVPCHRVLAADRSLRGYGGGLATKRWLLELEGVLLEAGPTRLLAHA